MVENRLKSFGEIFVPDDNGFLGKRAVQKIHERTQEVNDKLAGR